MAKQKAQEDSDKAKLELQASVPVVQERNSGMLTSSGFSSGDSHLNRDGTHPVTKTGNILLGVVATSLTSGALYRFTPLGSMLRNRFGWNHNMRNFNGRDNGLFDYASESFNPYSGGAEEHYIGYQPA
ncbi:hypothetical protein PVMG_05529 [Plasmodium vivax Mauritania I]|uniref:Vir protein n=1 Tax=Plasmodium vivax Mauritania I TaxID=1035515 RepID=A0A0J9W3Q2_PLAVI|nr:hypothetical protein PVMG_05529 [Plasmodium vivax Mauritania I]